MEMTALPELAELQTWGIALAIAGLGASGGLVHQWVIAGEPAVRWKTGILGGLTALGLSAIELPIGGVAQIGSCVAAGFVARAVLAALWIRVDLVVSRQQTDRALALARDAIELSRRHRTTPGSSGELDPGGLAARLDEVRASGPTRPM